ncbi:MAG: hypothetical protein JWQ43_1766 [Glaciihabitans sp.]|nr:hypothetical protein [Glaciihabitans sp.]
MTTDRISRALVICGVPASGKTTFARDVAQELAWTILDLDTLTNPLFEHAGGEFLVDVPTAEPSVRASINEIRYTCLFDTARENLALGVNVILVAPFTSERMFSLAWDRLVSNLGVTPERVTLAWMDTPVGEVVNRMQQRGAARDLEKIEHPDRFLTADVTSAPAVPHIRIDGLLSPTEQVDRFVSDFALAATAR